MLCEWGTEKLIYGGRDDDDVIGVFPRIPGYSGNDKGTSVLTDYLVLTQTSLLVKRRAQIHLWARDIPNRVWMQHGVMSTIQLI